MHEPTYERTDVEEFQQFLRDYYKPEIGDLARGWPDERRSLEVDYSDVQQWLPELADELLDGHAEGVLRKFDAAIASYDTPVDVDLSGAIVRIANLPETRTFWPRGFSPSDRDGQYAAIQGEVSKATDVRTQMDEVAFRCVRCETLTRVPQTAGKLQEPHQCRSCERQGPFDLERQQSKALDAQTIALRTPPEHATTAGDEIVAHLEEDLTDLLSVGDRVRLSGILELAQDGDENSFEPELDTRAIEIEQSDRQELDVSQEERDRIEALANGAEGDPLTAAAKSLSTKIHGHLGVKKALVLAAVGGSHVEYDGDDEDRGKFHVLLIGDPATGKSKLVKRVSDVMLRSVSASSTMSTSAGLLSTAVQDDFGAGDWTLKPGAFAKANGGVVAIDELDDMEPSVRASILEPMANQKVDVNKGGINTTIRTRTAVIAAANPSEGRFDRFQPIPQQFDFGPTMMSRFDLVYTFKDKPDEESDRELADHILSVRDAAKGDDGGTGDASGPIEQETLQTWIALASEQDEPQFAEGVLEHLRESWARLRALYDYDDDSPIPVTARKLEGAVRVAEAAAKLEFSDEIEMRHAEIATERIGESMQDIGMDEDGQFDADVVETGTSKTQRDRIKSLRALIGDLTDESGNGLVDKEELLDTAVDIGISRDKAERELKKILSQGEASEPETGKIRYLGRR